MQYFHQETSGDSTPEPKREKKEFSCLQQMIEDIAWKEEEERFYEVITE